MEWLDPTDGMFKDAFLGNSDHGASSQFIPGPYVSPVDFQLGNYGVDPINHTVWAVVDHNSEFVVGNIQAVPEPCGLSAVLVGFGVLTLHRFRRSAASLV